LTASATAGTSDIIVDDIFEQDIRKPLQQSSAVGRDLNEVLTRNGISFQIYVATRGESILKGKHGNS